MLLAKPFLWIPHRNSRISTLCSHGLPPKVIYASFSPLDWLRFFWFLFMCDISINKRPNFNASQRYSKLLILFFRKKWWKISKLKKSYDKQFKKSIKKAYRLQSTFSYWSIIHYDHFIPKNEKESYSQWDFFTNLCLLTFLFFPTIYNKQKLCIC